MHQRLGDHPRADGPHPRADAGRPGGFRRRDRRGRRGAHGGRGPRRRRARRRRLRGAARRARPQARPRRTRCSRTPTSAPTSRRSGASTRPRPGTGGDVDEAIEKARADGIVIEREYRQQRLIPAFMEPRSVVVDPTGEQLTHVVRHPDPAHPAVRAGGDHGHPRVQDPGHRARRRRRLRRQAPDHARGVDHLRGGPPARQAGEVHRDPLRVADGGPPRPRPVAEAHPGRHQGRHRHRPQGRPARRPRRLRRPRRRRRAGARRVHVQRDLQVRRLPVQLPDGADEQDLDRRLPRRRAGRRPPSPSSG